GRHPARGRPGRGRREPGPGRLPGGGAGAVRPHRRAAGPRRGPDGPRADGEVVRLRALRHPARRRDDGQGPGQRRSHRGLLGHRRGGGRLRARRPRHDLRRPAAGRPGGAHDAADHAAGERARTGRPGRGPAGPGAGVHARGGVGAGARPVAGGGTGAGDRLQGGGGGLPRRRARRQRRHSDGPAVRAVAPRHRRRHRRGPHDPRKGAGMNGSGGANVAHFLDVDDLSAPALRRVLDRAAGWKESGKVPDLLSGRAVAALFQKPSARTRVSFEVAVATLGGHCVTLRGEELGLGSRESVADVARTLASYCTVIGARVFDHRVLEEMARVGGIPVINLLSDTAHPGQAVGDLLTLEEHLGGPIEGRRLAFVGDGNNVAASLALAAALTGLEIVVSSPPGYELDDTVVERARNLGGFIELVADPYEAVHNADAVYTDVWTSMGQEAENEARQAAFATYQVNGDLMAAARPDTLVLHCLPAKRGFEITDDVLDGPNSVVWTQAENRMHSYRSILVELTGEA